MKVVLLALGSDSAYTRDWLRRRYPGAAIESLPRAEFEKGAASCARLLRELRPEIFAISTERLSWQRGQNALLLFGALAGAHRIVLLDSHGEIREESRAKILLNTPAKLAREIVVSALTMLRAKRRLKQLERAVESDVWLNRDAWPSKATRKATEIVYLRETPAAGTGTGGASSHISGFVKAMLSLGTRIRIVSNDRLSGVDEKAMPIRIIAPEPVGTTRAAFDIHNNFLFSRGALAEIEHQPPDFIYERYSRFALGGVEASLRTRRPLFLEYNGSEVWVGTHWDAVGRLDLLARYERLNLSAAARIFVVSEVEFRNLLRAGVPAGKVVVNPNGVDVERFRPGVGGEQVRLELGIKADETLVGFVGTFGPWHGVLSLAESIKLTAKEGRLKFLLIGSGKLRSEVEKIVHDAGAAERVIFTGSIPHEDVPGMLDACDVLVSPHVPLADGSEFFGSPTKIFEYMAMGKGIVASRLGQIGVVLDDEKTALLVEPGNVSELTEGITRLAGSRELRERLGSAARRAAVEHHTWKHNAQRVLDAYRRMD